MAEYDAADRTRAGHVGAAAVAKSAFAHRSAGPALRQMAINLDASAPVVALKALGARLSNRIAPLPIQRAAPAPSNRTGLPDHLKQGVETLSGLSMDDVHVHRDSARPALVQAHAYAQGNDIYLAPGQERHLPHEAWHVVQQKQGRVAATMQLAGGVAVNDDRALEAEADAMGLRAAASPDLDGTALASRSPAGRVVTQRQVRGLEAYTTAASIPGAWIDAFIADTDNAEAHLYLPDMMRYLDAHSPGWTARAKLVWNANHWNVEILATGQVIHTCEDGNCGAYAIYAITHGVEGGNPENFSAPGEFVTGVRAAIRAMLIDRNEIADRIATEIGEADTLAETGFGPGLTDILRPFEMTVAREEERVMGGGDGMSSEGEKTGSDESGGSEGKEDPKVAEQRMENIFSDLDLAISSLDHVEDIGLVCAWLISQQGSGPPVWQEALNEVTERDDAKAIVGIIRMMAPLDPAEATLALQAKVRELLAMLKSSRGSGPPKGGSKDYTEELAGPMGRLAVTLADLETNREPEKGAKSGGLDRLAKLIADYERTYGTDAEWSPGEEYFSKDLARRAVGFYNLMTSLGETILAMPLGQRKALKGFISDMLNWQSSTCHNIVVKGLKSKLGKK